jgi:para-aminobenzoate synthetase/4-amino-4-deoxychorismate lyase
MDKGVSAVLRAAGRDERPFALVGAWSGGRALVGSEPLLVAEDAEDPFAVLDEQPELTGTAPGATGGGWVGYLGYGLGGLVERLPASPPRPVPVPISALAFYDHLLACDESGQWWFEALWSDEHAGRLESRLSEWRRRAGEAEAEAGQFECGRFLLHPEPETHLVSVARAIEHIRSGDVFQVNVCTRLEADFSGDPLELFCAGADRLVPRYGAFLGHRSFAVASFSPELFLKRRGREVLSSPIKGTARRERCSARLREQLLGSDKDRAENLMIVDLVRNDLGRVCRYGSVEVPELCRAEEHPGVWHLTSDVTGELCEGVSDAELLRAAFPPGSVTGAPKVRAMELVTVLEGTGREVYTGAIGIASPLTGLELNVAIRTFEMAGGKVWLGVGGGVVADSEPDRELEECLDKARPLLAAIGAELGPARSARSGMPPVGSAEGEHFQAALGAGVFETILVIDGHPVELESHLGRLAASVLSLYGSRLSPRLGAQVAEAAASSAGSQRLRVRVYPSPGGGQRSEVSVLAAPEAFSGLPAACVALVPTVLPDGLGRHKWHDRRVLADRRGLLGLGRHEELLLLDEDGAVLETEQANVLAVFGKVVRTPPLDGRILAGTTREAVLRLAALEGFEVSEEPFVLADLVSAEEVLLVSSIRGLCSVSGLRKDRSFGAGPVGAQLAKALWALWKRVVRPDCGLVPEDSQP